MVAKQSHCIQLRLFSTSATPLPFFYLVTISTEQLILAGIYQLDYMLLEFYLIVFKIISYFPQTASFNVVYMERPEIIEATLIAFTTDCFEQFFPRIFSTLTLADSAISLTFCSVIFSISSLRFKHPFGMTFLIPSCTFRWRHGLYS